MADRPEGYRRPPSTTWETRTVKIRRRPSGPAGRRAKPGRWWSHARLRPRERLTLTIHYRGGAEAWYQIEARGSMGRFPGVSSLHDVMSEIYGGRSWYISDE